MFKAVNKNGAFAVTKNNKIIARCISKFDCLKAVWVHTGSNMNEYYSFINDTDIVNVGVEKC